MDEHIVNPAEAKLLSVVREAFDRKGTWPTRQHVEVVLDQDHDVDLDQVLETVPRSLVRTTGIQESSEVILTVAGLAAAGAERDVGHFVDALRWCVEAAVGFRPADPNSIEEVKLEAPQFESEWASRGEEVTDIDLVKLHAMLITEGLHGGMSGEGHKWNLTLNRRRLLPYREVATIADYLKARVAAEAPPVATPSPAAAAPVAVPEEAPRPDVLVDAPAKLREACEVLFAQGHFEHAALDAVKVMTDVLREASDLTLDGDALAGAAFNLKDPKIVVGDLETETGRSRQRGVMLIAQGIYAAVRNPLAHGRIKVPKSEGVQIVAMIAFVLDAVEGGDKRRSWGVGIRSPEGSPASKS